MLLRSSPASPFGRKVKIVAALLGLDARLDVAATDTNDPADPLRRDNPLGKIPTLLTDDGIAVYDSRVIVEFLDDIAGGGRVIPLRGPERIACLTRLALADGISDAALLQVYEGRFRPAEKHEAAWVALQAGKVERGLAWLEARIAPPGDVVLADEVAIACALGYLDLRFGGRWREAHPRLVGWLDTFAVRVPAFEATRFKG